MDSDGFTIVKSKKGKGKQSRNVFDTSVLLSTLENDSKREENLIDVDKFIR